MEKYIRRYQFFLACLNFFSRILPQGPSNWAATWIARYLSHRLDDKHEICEVMKSNLQGNIDEAWVSYISHAGVSENYAFHYARLTKGWLKRCVEIKGSECIQSAGQARPGVLVLTYHHHYNLLLCVVLGLMGYTTSPIAMSFRDHPLYKYMGDITERVHREASEHFNGGGYLFVSGKRSYIRDIVRAFQDGHLVVTANDFPSPFAEKRNIILPLLGRRICCPTGSVEIALRGHCPMVTAFLLWLGRDRFRLTIQPVEGTSVDSVMSQYLATLESMIAVDPGLWEGWRTGIMTTAET